MSGLEAATPNWRFRMRFGAGVFYAAATLAATPLTAGIFCGDRISGGAATGANKEAASDAATAWWSSRAGALGRGYENWDAANEKKMSCTEGVNGNFTCTATAKPCLPDGAIPDTGKRLDL